MSGFDVDIDGVCEVDCVWDAVRDLVIENELVSDAVRSPDDVTLGEIESVVDSDAD